MKPTSDGLRELLQRNGITPTGNSALDIELAREFMPINWSDMLNEAHLIRWVFYWRVSNEI